MATNNQLRILRVVVASPGDVQPERDVLPEILSELNSGVAEDRRLRLELSRWETDTYPSFHPEGPQAVIDCSLSIADCDVLIGIFWKRFGTPVNDAQSGTEHEFRLAYESWKRKGRPQIQFYFNQKAYAPKTEEEIAQWGKVLHFQKHFPKEGLWWPYNGKRQFEGLVRKHLTQFLRHRFTVPTLSTAKSPVATGEPKASTTRPFDVSLLVSSYLAELGNIAGARIRRNLLIFETSAQRTWLSFTSVGLLCVLDNRLTDGPLSVKWYMPLEQLRSANVTTARYGNRKGVGLLSIGRRRNWLFSTGIFSKNLPLKQIVQEEIRKLT